LIHSNEVGVVESFGSQEGLVIEVGSSAKEVKVKRRLAVFPVTFQAFQAYDI
jgi:hypothetical protein